MYELFGVVNLTERLFVGKLLHIVVSRSDKKILKKANMEKLISSQSHIYIFITILSHIL